MKAVVIYDTKHGSSAEAAEAVARGLGSGTSVVRIQDAPASLADFDLVVLGGPIYMGSWPKSLAEFARDRCRELEKKRLACFALGSLPQDYEATIKKSLPTVLSARNPQVAVLGGRMEAERLGAGERLITGFVRKSLAKEGKTERRLDLSAAERFGASLKEKP